MSWHLSNKNVVFVSIAVGVLLVGGAFVFNMYKDNKTAENETLQVNKNIKITSTQAVALDSDGDGLKDWEEILLGTDPKNPDTNGNGIPDGQEKNNVTENFNKINHSKADTSSYTEALSLKLFKGYVDLKQQNSLGTNIESNFVSKLVKNNLPTISYKIYTKKDIVIDTKNAQSPKERALIYKTSLDTAWSPLFSVKEDELITFARIIDKGDLNGITKLMFAKNKYKEAVQGMLRISVPSDATLIQLDILNSFSFFIGVLDTMINVGNDPTIALVAIDGYSRGEKLIKESIGRLKIYLNTKQVTK